MALLRWYPARDLLSIRDDMNRLFNEFFGRAEGQEGSWLSGAWAPPVDIHETDGALILRTFMLPATVDSEKVTASYKDGVLELRLPKRETAKSKRIAIGG
jgi:HSP20 family molecular chaperone IbpA